LPTPQLQLTSGSQLLDNLKPGQVLQATALSENLGGKIRLQIGSTELTASTHLSARPGQSLLLEVAKTEPLPELKLLTPPGPEQVRTSAFKQLLPRQQPLSRLFDKLVDSNAPSVKQSIPAIIRQEIQALLNRLPSVEHPRFVLQFGEALLQSGILSEAHLIQGRLGNSDIKLELLKLLALVEPLIPRQQLPRGQTSGQMEASNVPGAATPGVDFLIALHKQLDAALARIQLNQLSSLPREDPIRQTWQFELPIRQGDQIDLFRITVKREQASSGAEEAVSWSLVLRMSFMRLGPMRIQLKLRGNAVSTLVWSENATTTELVMANRTTLQGALERVGLEVEKIAACTAKLEEESWIPGDTPLVSEKA